MTTFRPAAAAAAAANVAHVEGLLCGGSGTSMTRVTRLHPAVDKVQMHSLTKMVT
jgi:hypothetical protein